VEDNGIGIDAVYAERVFAPFKRLHGLGEYPGVGLGLSVCKRAVERLGGRIWVDTASDGGSTFSFTIPDAPEGADATRQ
jgi:signal transduction histidine kinase